MIYLPIFLVITFLTIWLNKIIIEDSANTNQYWHIIQFYQQCFIYISFGLMIGISGVNPLKYYVDLAGYGLMYMFTYNTGLNLMRVLPIDHLNGRYDRFPFWLTVFLFLIGFTILIIAR
jgi:hypothetical protein